MPRMTLTLERLDDGRLLLSAPRLPGWSTVGYKGADLPRMVEEAWREHAVRAYTLRRGGAYHARVSARPELVRNEPAGGVVVPLRGRPGRRVTHSSGLSYAVRGRLAAARTYTVADDGSVVTEKGRVYSPGSSVAASTRRVLADYGHVSDEALHSPT